MEYDGYTPMRVDTVLSLVAARAHRAAGDDPRGHQSRRSSSRVLSAYADRVQVDLNRSTTTSTPPAGSCGWSQGDYGPHRPQDHRRHLWRPAPVTAAAPSRVKIPPRSTAPPAYMARYVAKNVVAAGLAARANCRWRTPSASPTPVRHGGYGRYGPIRRGDLPMVRAPLPLDAARHHRVTGPATPDLPPDRLVRPFRPHGHRPALGASTDKAGALNNQAAAAQAVAQGQASGLSIFPWDRPSPYVVCHA